MPMTKRTRFEVLRRDGFRCYYCGVRGNETGEGLTIDHVTPVSLGGTDDPSNLVSACRDCNSGKSSMPADAETVADVDKAAATYARARALALQALEANMDAETEYVDTVVTIWDETVPSYAGAPRDIDSFAEGWYKRGVPLTVVRKAIRVAWDGPAGRAQKLTYAAGVIRNIMADAEDLTKALVAGESVVWNDGVDSGFKEGYDDGLWAAAQVGHHFDHLSQHIDAQKLQPSGRDDKWMRAMAQRMPAPSVHRRLSDAA